MSRETKLTVPQNELFYHDETTGSWKPLAQGGAIPVVVVNGGIGGSSMNFIIDEGVPTEDIGNDGDVYLDSNSGDIFKKENEDWIEKGNLKGDKGDKGDTGAKGETGATGATGEAGQNGADGKDGVDGADGQDGADGFGTEAQYNDIIARLELIEEALSSDEAPEEPTE